MAARTLVHALRERAALNPDLPALWKKPGDRPYRPSTWREVSLSASRIGRGLLALRLPEDRPVAVLCGPFSDWLPLELGAMGAGYSVAPLLPDWSDELLSAVLRRLGATTVIVGGQREWERIRALRPDLGILAIDVPAGAPESVRSFASLQAEGERLPEATWLERLEGLEPGAPAAHSVTLSVDGAPSIVRHSHRAVLAHAQRLARALGIGEGDVLLSRLPPERALERAMLRLVPLAGAQLYTAPAEGGFGAQLREAGPNVVHAAPEDWEALRRTIEQRLEAGSPNRQRAVAWGRRVCLASHRRLDDYLPVPGPTLAQHKLAQILVFEPLKLEFGLHAARMRISGLGRLRQSTLEFFASLDLPLGEAWGLVEAGGPIALNVDRGRRQGSQGRPLPGVAARVSQDGELLLRSDTTCIGGEDAEGWLHTGERGELDPDGFVRVEAVSSTRD